MLLVLAFFLLLLTYWYTTRNHTYWARRNVKHDAPLPLVGNHLPNLLVNRTVVEMGVEMYNKYCSEKIVGYYRGRTPELIIRDPQIVKRILNVDFMHFYSRESLENSKRVPLLHNLFFTTGDQWRLLRQRLTPTFSASKLRAMFPLVLRCTEMLQNCAENLIVNESDINACELMSRYTMDFIGSCGFGIDLDTINFENSLIFQEVPKFLSKSKSQMFIIALHEILPELKLVQSSRLIGKELVKLIINMTKKVREQRGAKVSGRNDYMDTLLEMEAMGKIRMESLFEKNPDGTPAEVELEMDVECAAAQVFVFFVAGYETSATATSFTLHQLAYHPEIQHNIQQEIDTVLSKYDNNLCYDALAEFSKLNMAFKEALRMLPPGGTVRRICKKRYTIPGTDVTIDPGVKILVPVQALHMDPTYYDNPKEFIPERFAPEEVKKRPSYVYLPFGEGPRKCPAGRLAEMQSLAGLAVLLHRFTVIPAPSSKRQYSVKKTAYVVQIVDGGLPIRFVPRNNIKF